MDHKHWTDIGHGHQVSDQGHFHTVPSARVALGSDWGGSYPQNTYRLDYTYDLGLHTTTELSGISVVDLPSTQRLSTESRYIGNEGVNRQYTESNDTNAIENRPKNYTVKIWKRTA